MIEEAGFVVNPRVVLAMDFFEDFRERNGINAAILRGASSEELRELIKKTAFDERERRTICEVARRFSGTPIAVRSSAHGDARGTGIYESEFCVNNKKEHENVSLLIDAIKKVLLSEFSDAAIAFRKDLGLQAGMAIIVEPVFGQIIEDEFFGPLYGAVAYTSTSAGPCYILISAGLPTSVVNGSGIMIREGENFKLWKIGIMIGAIISEGYNIETRTIRFGGPIYSEIYKKLSSCDRKGNLIYLLTGSLMNSDVPINNLHYELWSWLFKKLKELEALVGKPQYIELCIRMQKDTPEVCVVQISDVNIKRDFYEFANTGTTVAKGTQVVGSGIIKCDKVAFVYREKDIDNLIEFNEKNKGFAVVYSGRLVSAVNPDRKLTYDMVNNATVLIEDLDCMHSSDPAEHWRGLMDSTGKLFFVAHEIKPDNLGTLTLENGLPVYNVNVKVTASERQQKATMEIDDS